MRTYETANRFLCRCHWRFRCRFERLMHWTSRWKWAS